MKTDMRLDYFQEKAVEYLLASGRSAMYMPDQKEVIEHVSVFYNLLSELVILYYQMSTLTGRPKFQSDLALEDFALELAACLHRAYTLCSHIGIVPNISDLAKTLSFMGRYQVKQAASASQVAGLIKEPTMTIIVGAVEGLEKEIEYVRTNGVSYSRMLRLFETRLNGIIECLFALTQVLGLNSYSLFNLYHTSEMNSLKTGVYRHPDIVGFLVKSGLIKQEVASA